MKDKLLLLLLTLSSVVMIQIDAVNQNDRLSQFWWYPKDNLEPKRWRGFKQNVFNVIYPEKIISLPSNRYANEDKPIALVKFEGKKYKPLDLFIINTASSSDYSDPKWPNGYAIYQLENGEWIEKISATDISDTVESDYLTPVLAAQAKTKVMKKFDKGNDYFKYLKNLEIEIGKVLKSKN